MSLKDKMLTPKPNPSILTQYEIEFLLLKLKNVDFKGGEVEVLYNIIYKLQQQHSQK